MGAKQRLNNDEELQEKKAKCGKKKGQKQDFKPKRTEAQKIRTINNKAKRILKSSGFKALQHWAADLSTRHQPSINLNTYRRLVNQKAMDTDTPIRKMDYATAIS